MLGFIADYAQYLLMQLSKIMRMHRDVLNCKILVKAHVHLVKKLPKLSIGRTRHNYLSMLTPSYIFHRVVT